MSGYWWKRSRSRSLPPPAQATMVISVHGTFPERFFEERPVVDLGSLSVGVCLGVLPLILAGLVAVAQFGSATTLTDVLRVLSAAAAGTIM